MRSARPVSSVALAGLGVLASVLGCAGRAAPLVCPPCPSSVPDCPSVVAPPPSYVAGQKHAFWDDQMKTTIVATWLPADHVAKGAGGILATTSNEGATAPFPRAQVMARLAALPRRFDAHSNVDVDAAFDRIEVLSKTVHTARQAEMEAMLATEAKKAPPGSVVQGRGDTATAYVQLSTDDTLTFSAWWTVRTTIEGPLVRAPMAHCLPGQPCAQMADSRSDASVSVTAGARYVVRRDGALVEEIVFAPRADQH